METLEQRIKMHEGFRAFPYLDTTNNLTLGYGRNLTDNGISKQEAIVMLQNDIDRAKADYHKLPAAVRDNCNTIRREVLVEMIFQLGLGGVLKFKRMLRAIQNNDFERAASEQIDSLWGRQTPNRAHELAGLMRKG